MNKIETASILAILKTAYPAFYKNSDEINDAINLWAMMFQTDSPKIVTEAVKAMIITLKYPPTIADVKEKIRLITTPDQMTEFEAWGIVYNAISQSSYRAQEEFEKLPQNIKRLIGSPNQLKEWALMESETVNSVIQSNFMRSFKTALKNESDRAMLPESTKQLISGLAERMAITDGSD